MNQKIKNYLGSAGIVAILVFAFAAWQYADSYSKSIQPSSFRSFSSSGEGRVTAIPDVAKFSFTVITEGGKDIGTLQNDTSSKVNAAIAFLKSRGIDAKDISTAGYDVQPRYESYSCPQSGGACPPSQIVGYTITQTTAVKVRDFKKIGDILSGIVSKGANRVSGLSFAIDDLTVPQDQARAQAIEKAKEKAKAVANAGGFRLGRLLAIYESGGPVPIPYYGMGGAMNALESKAANPPTIEAGSQDVTVNVTLQYEIE